MCIRYDEALTKLRKSQKKLIYYKLFRVEVATDTDADDGNLKSLRLVLCSPFRTTVKGGIIQQAGTHKAHNIYAPKSGMDSYIYGDQTRLTLSEMKKQDKSVHCWGYHALKDKDKMNCLEHRAIQDAPSRSLLKIVIVPISVKPEDIIMAGTEDTCRGAESVTCKAFTISKRAFQKAIAVGRVDLEKKRDELKRGQATISSYISTEHWK